MSSPSGSGSGSRPGPRPAVHEPSFRETAHPEFATLAGPGLRIHAERFVAPDGRLSLRVNGFCRAANDTLSSDGPPLLNRISLVLVHGPEHLPTTFPALGDAATFEDDLRQKGAFVEGFFEVDLFERLGMQALPGEHYISATLDAAVSNVVRVEL